MHVLWSHATFYIFDIWLSNVNATIHRGYQMVKVMANQDPEKETKYLKRCLEIWRYFIALACTVESITGGVSKSFLNGLHDSLLGSGTRNTWRC